MIHNCTFEGCLKSVEWPAVFFLPPKGWTWLERWGLASAMACIATPMQRRWRLSF